MSSPGTPQFEGKIHECAFAFHRGVVATAARRLLGWQSTDILNGKKVVVVSHSQGNFYVNEARDLLAKQLRNGKMSSFAAFGVATPANNVIGARLPYLTNHRDFIQYVPRALPANWKLYRSDKSDADDIGVIQAHLFNITYISDEFDIKPQLISGIKTQIDGVVKPMHSCQTYVANIASLVAGRYITSCGFKPNLREVAVSITESGMTYPEVGWVDLTAIDSSASLDTDPQKLRYPVEFAATGSRIITGASWDLNRRYLGRSGPCIAYEEETTPSFLAEIPRISDAVLPLLGNIYRLLPKESCIRHGFADIPTDKPVEFAIEGGRVRLGDKTWPISGDAESVTASYRDIMAAESPTNFADPVLFFSSRTGSTDLYIEYARNREITHFIAVDEGNSMIQCTFHHESGKSFAFGSAKL
jgi:hypothetical protein